MHGADWPAVKRKYAAFLPDLATRDDLYRVMRWMLSELGVGHSYLFPPERLDERRGVPGGLLGADYEVAHGRYRFKKVYGGLNWNPELRSPLTAAGRGREGRRVPAGRPRHRAAAAHRAVLAVREHGRQEHRNHRRPQPGRPRQPHRDRRAAGRRNGAAEPRLGRGEPQARPRGDRRPGGLRLRARHLDRRPRLLQALLLSPVRPRRHHRRRAFQQRRASGRLLHRAPHAAGLVDVGHPLRRRRPRAQRGDPRPQGHADRRDGRLRRRHAALDVPQAQARPAGRHAHLGRPGRDARLPRA